MTSNSCQVLVCQNRTCRKSGSPKILKAFEVNRVPEFEVISVQCLGQCGNGPMVLVLPEKIWYWQVHPDDVPVIVQQHLKGHSPITELLYPKFHRN